MTHSVAVENIIIKINNLIIRGKFKLSGKKKGLGVKLVTCTMYSVRSKYKAAKK